MGAGGRAEVKIARLSYQITVTKPIFKWAWPRGSESRPQHTSAASILLSAPTSPCDVRHVGRTSVSPNPSHRLSIYFPSSARNLSPRKHRTIVSAVIIPSEEGAGTPPGRFAKRRQSFLSPESAKRPRLNHDSSIKYEDGEGGHDPEADIKAEEQAKVKAESDDESSRPSRRPPRRVTGKDEERKRGKRLFGALLGTIGKFQQDSSSARARTSAVKRREAEAKTQERLKQQTEEIDERRKKQDQDISLKRRMEQREFDERAVSISPSAGWGLWLFKHAKRRPV